MVETTVVLSSRLTSCEFVDRETDRRADGSYDKHMVDEFGLYDCEVLNHRLPQKFNWRFFSDKRKLGARQKTYRKARETAN